MGSNKNTEIKVESKNAKKKCEVSEMPEMKCPKCNKNIAYDLNPPYRCPYCREMI